MFHVKQLLWIIFVLNFYSYCFSEEKTVNFDRFLKIYRYKMFFNKKEVGYIVLEISSTSTGGYQSKVESYTDIPILFFSPKSKSVEVEEYDNNFIPINSVLNAVFNEKNVEIKMEQKRQGVYFIEKIEDRKKKSRQFEINEMVITPGNVIPIVSTYWDFKQNRSIKLRFIDKNKLSIEELSLKYDGRTTDGYHKISVSLSSYIGRYNIYLDDDKNIIYAEGMGLKVYSE